MLLLPAGQAQCIDDSQFASYVRASKNSRFYQVEYAVPSLEIAFDPLCTSLIPGSC
jgi:hypothetical protein